MAWLDMQWLCMTELQKQSLLKSNLRYIAIIIIIAIVNYNFVPSLLSVDVQYLPQ